MGVVGTAWALDAVTGAPSYTGRVIRQTNSPTLAGATTARPFGAISGVRPGTSTTTITSTSTTWTAQTFAGVIDLEASALSGAYGFAFNLVTSGSVTASNASNPRIDILSVRIDDPAEGDGSTVPAVTMVYTAGTAAGSPVAPAAPARSFAVAQLAFPAGSGTTPTVTWVAPYTVAAGADQVAGTSVTALAITGGYLGEKAKSLADGIQYRWNGATQKAWDSDWITYTPTLTNMTLGNGTFAADYKYVAGRVQVRYIFTLGSTSAMGSVPQFTLPVTHRAITFPFFQMTGMGGAYDVSAGNAPSVSNFHRFNVAQTGNIPVTILYTPAGVPANITAAAPMTWAVGDVLHGEFIYDPA